MKTLKNDYCIKMFVGNDEFRPSLNEVNLRDGYLYAINTHVLAKIKADLCVKTYKENEKYPDAERLFNKHVNFEEHVIKTDEFLNEMMKIDICFLPSKIVCDKCDGSGVYVCEHCGNESDCDECNGSGYVRKGKLEIVGEEDCFLLGRKYKIEYLDLILKTAIITGTKELHVSNSEKKGVGTIFTVGDFEILLMDLYF